MSRHNSDQSERAALFKLFTGGHINVEERGCLPESKVRATVARDMIEKALTQHQWFPGETQKPVGDEGGSYSQLGIEDGKVNLHMNQETAYMRYGHIVIRHDKVGEAIDAFLVEKEKRSDLDGLKIDWSA